jgi:hypothetical protein
VNKRTKFLLGIGVIAALVIAFQVAAFAVHDTGVFELDGNATNDPNVDGDDWDNSTAKTFVAEPNLNATIFTGGGSKDPQDISKWAWKDGAGGLPDKDNLLDAYAARYTDDNGDELLYFGADRYDNSGDAHMGFWFLQDEVALGTNSIGGGTGFTGVHTEGDVLVVTNFSNGGTTSTITVYEWNTACTKAGVQVDHDNDDTTPDLTCGDANLLILGTSDAALCSDLLADDPFCGIVNSGTITLPWSFNDKTPGGTTNSALQGEFFEGGLNLTELGLADECFSTFAVETRSSTSTTATLKDFILGEFENCESTIKTQASGSGTVAPGTLVTDTATITGAGTSPLIDPTGTVDFFLCGPSTTADFPDCSTGGTDAGTDKPLAGGTNTTDGISTAQSDAVNTATSPLTPGKYCFAADYSGDDNYEGGRHTNTDPASTTGGECFTVSQPTSITTDQSWLPQDSATVTPANTAGTVVFSLYENGTCSGTAARTFEDTSAPYATDNTTYVTTSTTISWSATFDPSGNEDPSTTTRCERSDLTINNSASDFPPPASP